MEDFRVTLSEALAIAFAGAVTAFLLLLLARALWHHATNWASRRAEHILATALARPLYYRDLDTEYRALVLAEHNAED